MGKSPTSMCNACKTYPESIVHSLWECEKVQTLITNLRQLIIRNDIHLDFTRTSFIFGRQTNKETERLDNRILLTIKQFIYRVRCLETTLSLRGLINYVQYELKAEKKILQNVNKPNINVLNEVNKWLDLQVV